MSIVSFNSDVSFVHIWNKLSMQIPWAAASWASYFDVLVLYWRLIYIYIFSRTTTLCHVRPSTNTSFPTRPCHTFSEYEKHPGKYFNDPNLTLQFLPGNHTPDVNVTKTNIHPLELLGNFSAAVTTYSCLQLQDWAFLQAHL